MKENTRRELIKHGVICIVLILLSLLVISCSENKDSPNLVFVFADQWRAQDTGYMGNVDVRTPTIDQLAREGANFINAVSTCPVCSPYRASLLTGQYPLTHGVFYNDKPLSPDAITIAEVFKNAGYNTGYIGKWHVDGHGRDSFIPKERRQGFDFWKVLECTHDYNYSYYYSDKNEKLLWDGYDAIAQTREAIKFINSQKADKPFLLFLSWGPPHGPYQTAPQHYRDLYKQKNNIAIRPNVPDESIEKALDALKGYYAHIAALDDCMAKLITAIEDNNIEDNTILVFTSDHGDMLFSQGMRAKQKPWDESIRVPLLIKYPAKIEKSGRVIDMPIGTPDIMPSLLGLCDLKIPNSVEGKNYAGVILGEENAKNDAVLIMLPVPFHQWNYRKGGKEYRGIRTRRYTYVEDLKGPWLLYDNKIDQYQMGNRIDHPEYELIKRQSRSKLKQLLSERNDHFLPGNVYMKEWGYEWYGKDAPSP